MKKNIDEILKQKMAIEEFEETSSAPELNKKAIDLIKARKQKNKTYPNVLRMVIDLFWNRYKAISIATVMIGIIIGLNVLCTFNLDPRPKGVASKEQDTSLTVSSNTYLATLKQSTIIEVPARTNTALTCISTFVARN